MRMSYLGLLTLSLAACGQETFSNSSSAPTVPVAKVTATPTPAPNDDQVVAYPTATPLPDVDPTVVPVAGATATPNAFEPLYLEGNESYNSDFDKPKVDIVWVIDNSSSMGEEAASVQKNFKLFLDKALEQVDLKLFLLSQAYDPYNSCWDGGPDKSSKCGVSLPNDLQAPQYEHIRTFVDSTNGLALAASASCDVSLSQFGYSNKICGLSKFYGTLSDTTEMERIRGTLASKFRDNAERAYIIVTDDNASGVNESNFIEMIKASSGKVPFLFAFRGIRNPLPPVSPTRAPKCNVTTDGLSYDLLAKLTGGAVFDICETDWSQNFLELGDKVAKLKETIIPLAKANVASITSIRVNGELIDASKYVLEGANIRVAAGVILAKGQKVEIKYTYKNPKYQ